MKHPRPDWTLKSYPLFPEDMTNKNVLQESPEQPTDREEEAAEDTTTAVDFVPVFITTFIL